MSDPGSFVALEEALGVLARGISPLLNVPASIWWDPSIDLPAAYWWMNESPVTADNQCQTVEGQQLTLSIAVKPGMHSGDDLHSLGHYIDLARPLLSIACADAETHFGGARRAKRKSLRLAHDTFGATKALVAEFTVEVTHHTLFAS